MAEAAHTLSSGHVYRLTDVVQIRYYMVAVSLASLVFTFINKD